MLPTARAAILPFVLRLATRIAFGLVIAASVAGAAPSDAEIRKLLVSESREAYSKSCPCPYDTDRAGRRCGKRSAYSRPGGEAPLCFDSDVTQEMIEAYRKRTASE